MPLPKNQRGVYGDPRADYELWNTPEEAIAEFNKIKGYARGGLVSPNNASGGSISPLQQVCNYRK